jgi:hypothetical protein
MTANNRLALTLALLALLAVPAANAAIAAAASFDEKVDNAAAIILGKCLKTESKFDTSGRWILTYSTFQVEQSLKGAVGNTVTVVTPGGSVGGVHQSSIGIPAFRAGDENVIFLKDSSLGPTVLYFDQGAYQVSSDGREKVVAPVPSSLVKIDEQRGVAVPGEQPRLLREFDTEVHASMRGSAARREQMEALQAKAHKQEGIGDFFARNWWIVLIAAAGLLFTGWQLFRR